MDKLLLRPETCAELLGVGRTQIYLLMSTGRLESVKLGRRRLVPREAVTAFVERVREEQAGEAEPARA